MEEQRRVEYLGKNIKYVRKNICHMTQNEFSEAIHLSVDQLQKIEQGVSLPSVPSLFAIAEYANIPIDFLSKDDITSSKLYSVITLMDEINKSDKDLIDNVLIMLQELNIKIRSL